MAIYKYQIYEGGKTVSDYLSSFNLGKEKIKYLNSHKNSILINNKESSLNDVLNINDILSLDFDEHLDIVPLKKKINIIYEDDYLLIINKPVNILVHSDGALNKDNNLANAVAYYYKNIGLDIPVRYCHRLDKDTTGLMIFVKDPLSESLIKKEIEDRKLHRTYRALVEGNIDKDIIINKPIGRNRHINGKYMVSKTGKEAITKLHVVKNFKKYSLVELNLLTGRTHQIRVHMQSIGHPILGDALYGGALNLIKRQALHSYAVSFLHPITKKQMNFEINLPFDMMNLTKRI